MQIVCPGCGTRFSFDVEKVDTFGIKLRCNKCKTVFRVVRKEPPANPAPLSEPVPTAAQPRIKVVVANESPAFCKAVTGVLAGEPFDVFAYHDGREALSSIMLLKPEVVLLDVALPSMYGFEVCEAIRKEPAVAEMKIILIASIYDKTRYKRAPLSLYGADDYIEKHHIPDALATKIHLLLGSQQPAVAPPEARPAAEDEASVRAVALSPQEISAQENTRLELKRDEEDGMAVPENVTQEIPGAHDKARRLARHIVSDIVLYNLDKVEKGVRNGIFYELLADDIKEGRALYESRVPVDIRNNTSYFDDGFNDLIDAKKKELGL
ncbi:MAG TPA: response regulator [Geobacteraceae bacterium]|nr:response regulator [Geobacteraceae bacterium]